MANNVTIEQLADIITNYLKANKICQGSFTASKDNVLGLLDKIGKTITIDGVFEDELQVLDGDNLPLGKTIEEYFFDFLPPKDYVKNAGVENVTAVEPTARPVKYSYTQGRKKWVTTRYFNDLERAFMTEEGASKAIARIVERLEQSYRLYRNGLKRELLGKFASQADSIMSSAVTYGATTAYEVGKAVKNGNEVGIVFNAKPATSITWDNAKKQGYVSIVNLSETISAPVDTDTGEAFIKRVKEVARIAKFDNENNLNGALTLPTPKDSLYLFIRSDLMPSLEVDTWAGAFHNDLLALPAKVVEVKDFGDNDDCIAVLCDARGVKIHNSYNATRETILGDDDAVKYVKHTEDTAFWSANTFVHVFKKSA